MKKTIVLLTIVLALVAAPVFAETGFTGSVEFKYGTDFSDFATDTGNDTKISLDGKVGEFSTISVGIEADENSNASATLMTLSQDVTGALGVEGPVSFAYKMGKQTYQPADYSGVGGYEDAGRDAKIGQGYEADDTDFTTNSMLGTVLTFGFADMIMIDAVVFPASYFEKAADAANGYFDADNFAEFAVNAYGTFGPAQVSVYYTMSNLSYLADSDGDAIDEAGDMIGANLGLVIDALSVGVLWETDLEKDFQAATGVTGTKPMNTEIGIAAKYVIGSVTPGIAFKTAFYDGSDFAADSGLGLNVTWAAAEMFNVTAAVKNSFVFDDLGDTLGYEVGVDYTLDGVKYSIGYTDGSEFKAYDAELSDTGNMYVKVGASF
ncbi:MULTISPECIES: hypothetical protein [unclassified Oceanispirochaeta]|uniref:hypothetical protein n=1 Tax=unclassified Oceanispirochaeta TaxID=2635722 RepID=UPI000E0916A5|nr:MULTISPECIES: hypothetical protein [unclassified Oceanispirochaeta]MBF9018067.1 hypothetical protein [Oceanispirochaeta sp. M2]NPD73852.1 hypothetical protein [Oceanispirochaeta sp. M1]RDG30314.1 hypothetical protein DV872_17290 [Oceanispirochaeta sp. M1]